MKVFLKNLCLRPSCYDCQSKSLHRNSDITLADFWGINYIYPKLYDNKGTSLVFINSQKGKELFENIKQSIEYKEVDIKEASKYNPSLYKSVSIPNKRNKYMENIFNNDFNKYSKKYIKTPFLLKLKVMISICLHKAKRIIKGG